MCIKYSLIYYSLHMAAAALVLWVAHLLFWFYIFAGALESTEQFDVTWLVWIQLFGLFNVSQCIFFVKHLNKYWTDCHYMVHTFRSPIDCTVYSGRSNCEVSYRFLKNLMWSLSLPHLSICPIWVAQACQPSWTSWFHHFHTWNFSKTVKMLSWAMINDSDYIC